MLSYSLVKLVKRSLPGYELSDNEDCFVGLFICSPNLSILLLFIRAYLRHPIYCLDVDRIKCLFIGKLFKWATNFISAINNLVTIVIPLILVILKQISCLLKVPYISVYKFKSINHRFLYSNSNPSLPSILYKLTINSTPESLSFTEGRAVLMLAHLLPFLRVPKKNRRVLSLY